MFKKNKSKLSILLALETFSVLGNSAIKAQEVSVSSNNVKKGEVFLKGNNEPSLISKKNESSQIDQNDGKLLNDLKNQIEDTHNKLQRCSYDCRKFKSKFMDMYSKKLFKTEKEYLEKVNEGKKLVSECFSINQYLSSLISNYKKKLISDMNSILVEILEVPNDDSLDSDLQKLKNLLKLDHGNIPYLEKLTSSNAVYLEHWLWFADGKFDQPPYEGDDIVLSLDGMSYDDMRSIEKEYELPIVDIDNIANNLFYVRRSCLDYYDNVNNGKDKFDPAVWNSIIEKGELWLSQSIQLNKQFLNAYSRKYDSIKSNYHLEELKNSVHKMIKHFEFNLTWLNKWSNYISTNKNAKVLPDPIKEF